MASEEQLVVIARQVFGETATYGLGPPLSGAAAGGGGPCRLPGSAAVWCSYDGKEQGHVDHATLKSILSRSGTWKLCSLQETIRKRSDLQDATRKLAPQIVDQCKRDLGRQGRRQDFRNKEEVVQRAKECNVVELFLGSHAFPTTRWSRHQRRSFGALGVDIVRRASASSSVPSCTRRTAATFGILPFASNRKFQW